MNSKTIIKNLFFIFLIFVTGTWGQNMINPFTLDGEWFYKLDPEKIGINDNWFKTGQIQYDGKIKVPSFWESHIEKEFDGWLWYFKEFEFVIPTNENKIALLFEGVDDDASIWLNGKFVGEHKGYSERFYFEITKSLNSGKNFIVVLVADQGGPGGIYKSVYLKPFLSEKELFETEFSKQFTRPSLEWVKNGIIYEIFPRSFSRNGSFKELNEKLTYLRELGVTILWLMPIHPIGEIKRKGSLGSPYSVKDYYEINPEYGTKQDFKIFVENAHKLGLKVIIDEVLNHCAWDNKLVKLHPDWFTKDKNGNLISPNSDWTDVVDFNYDNKELRKYMIEMLKYWIREFDIDGFRFDVSELVPLDFWEEARNELEKVKPQFWLSEGTLPEHHLKAFDMTYSWNIYDLFKPILNKERSPQAILNSIKLEEHTFPKNSLRMRFNENHDKIRAANIFGYDGSLITAAVVFALNGVPLVHSGEEMGEQNFSSLFEKTEISWPEDFSTNTHYQIFKQLIDLRKRNPQLSTGKISPINIDETILAFTNTFNNRGIFAIFNFSSSMKSIDLNFVEELKNYIYELKNVIGRKFSIDLERMGRPADKIINLDPMGFIIIEISK